MSSELPSSVCVCVYGCVAVWSGTIVNVSVSVSKLDETWVCVCACGSERGRNTKNAFTHSYTQTTVCLLHSPLKYPADSNQIPVDVSSQQTDQWRLPVRSSDPGLPGSLAVHPPWRLEVNDRGGGLEAGGNGRGGIASKYERTCW